MLRSAHIDAKHQKDIEMNQDIQSKDGVQGVVVNRVKTNGDSGVSVNIESASKPIVGLIVLGVLVCLAAIVIWYVCKIIAFFLLACNLAFFVFIFMNRNKKNLTPKEIVENHIKEKAKKGKIITEEAARISLRDQFYAVFAVLFVMQILVLVCVIAFAMSLAYQINSIVSLLGILAIVCLITLCCRSTKEFVQFMKSFEDLNKEYSVTEKKLRFFSFSFLMAIIANAYIVCIFLIKFGVIS